MGRLNWGDEFASSSPSPLGALVVIILLAYAFISWGGAARLRLSVFLLLLLGLMCFGFSLGGKLGVLLFLSSIFVPIFLFEPISTFIESSIIKKNSNDDDTET